MTDSDQQIEQVLLDLMQAPTDPRAVDLAGLSEMDWSALVDLAQQHRCAAYLAHFAARAGATDMPERLRYLRQRIVHRSMNIQRECLAIHRILSEAGIHHLFLKGVPLALRDYPEPWTRPMRDIDVLVEPGRLEDAHRLLVAAGGEMQAYADAPVEQDDERKHLHPVHSPNRILPVEIHYKLILPTVALTREALAWLDSEVWREPATVKLADASLPVPAIEVLLAHLIIHGILDHELNNGPLFVTDIVHLLRNNRIDGERWHRLVERLGLHQAVALTASLLPQPEQAVLAAGGPPALSLPRETARLLMLQPAARRNQLKLEATLAEAPPGGTLDLLTGKLFPGRATLERRWRTEKGAAAGLPPLPLAWGWYLLRKAGQHFAPKTDREQRTLAALRELRRLRSGASGRG